MIKSREVRWFFEESNTHLAHWFRSQGVDFTHLQPRIDYYHKATLSKALGIKIREGRLEMKHRVSGPYSGELFNGHLVDFEEWIKWGFELIEDDPEIQVILESREHPDWLAVEKQRMAIIFGLDQRGESQISGSVQFPERGCQAEYTELKILGKTWYTFGLEWFGEPWTDLSPELVNLIFTAVVLQTENIRSYPYFLSEQLSH